MIQQLERATNLTARQLGSHAPHAFDGRRLSVVAVLLWLVAALVSGCGSRAATVADPTDPIRSMELATVGFGWALTATRLAATTDAGTTWTTITPTGAAATNVVGVQFLSASSGIAIIRGASPALARTSTGGAAWSMTPLTFDPSTSSTFNFADELHGIVLNTIVANANASKADAYVTADGGQAWTKFAGPGAGTVRMSSPTRAWVASRDHLYRSDDGGATWQSVSVPVPSRWQNALLAYDAPKFVDAQLGVLVVSFTNTDDSGVGFYVSRDGGTTWSNAFSTPVNRSLGGFARVPYAIGDRNNWIAVEPSATRSFATQDGGGTLQTQSPVGLPQGVVAVSASGGTTWALSHPQSCAGPKEQQVCAESWQLSRSTDRGQSWTPLAP